MKLSCRIGWHGWKNWSLTPTSSDGGKQWYGGQVRQCFYCYFVQVKAFDKAVSINLRPLRDAVREHLATIESLNGELPESFEAGAAKLRTELRKDEGIPMTN